MQADTTINPICYKTYEKLRFSLKDLREYKYQNFFCLFILEALRQPGTNCENKEVVNTTKTGGRAISRERKGSVPTHKL